MHLFAFFTLFLAIGCSDALRCWSGQMDVFPAGSIGEAWTVEKCPQKNAQCVSVKCGASLTGGFGIVKGCAGSDEFSCDEPIDCSSYMGELGGKAGATKNCSTCTGDLCNGDDLFIGEEQKELATAQTNELKCWTEFVDTRGGSKRIQSAHLQMLNARETVQCLPHSDKCVGMQCAFDNNTHISLYGCVLPGLTCDHVQHRCEQIGGRLMHCSLSPIKEPKQHTGASTENLFSDDDELDSRLMAKLFEQLAANDTENKYAKIRMPGADAIEKYVLLEVLEKLAAKQQREEEKLTSSEEIENYIIAALLEKLAAAEEREAPKNKVSSLSEANYVSLGTNASPATQPMATFVVLCALFILSSFF